AGEAGALVFELVLEDALEADDVADQKVALHRRREVPAGEDFDAGARPGSLLVDLRRVGVLHRVVHAAGEESAVVRLGAGAVVDEILAPAVPDVAVRVGERMADVDLELLRPRLVAEDAGVGTTLR